MAKSLFILMIGLAGFNAWAVWDELQNSFSEFPGQVLRVDPLVDRVSVTYVRKGQSATETVFLCNDFGQNQNRDNSRSEEQRAAFFREHMVDLRQARDRKKTVNLIYRGPWDPCLVNVSNI